MSCPLLEYVFTAASKEIPAAPLLIELGVEKGGIIIAGSNPTISGSGKLAYTPYHRVTLPNSPFHFFAPPLFRGTLACTATWQTPEGPQSSPQDVTIQIAAPFILSQAYSVSLTTSAEAAIPINGSFVPICTYIFGENHGSLTGDIAESSVKMNLIVHPHPF